MNRPIRRAWEGVLVSIFASSSLAGLTPIAPVREDLFVCAQIEVMSAAVGQAPIIAESPALPPTIDELAAEVLSEHFEPLPELLLQRTPTLRTLSVEVQPALQATAVPLPPALWPGAITLAGVALAMVIRQHRRA